MKIVSDFDGVLTDLTAEAARVCELFSAHLRHHNPLGDAALNALLQRARTQVHDNPTAYGWHQHGRLSAYANEDGFMANIGLAACLDQLVATDADADAIAQALHMHDIASFEVVCQTCYTAMVEETRRGSHHPIEPAAVRTLQQLLDQGHDVVVVSNSSTTRIIDLLRAHDLTPADHAADPTHRFRVRGDARKFALGTNSHGFHIGDYWVDTDRPAYDAILRDERPHAVIGDVFTLDLSLPLELSRSTPEHFDGIQLFLRQRPYTPDWARDFVGANEIPSCHLHLLQQFSDLPETLARNNKSL